MKKFFLLALVVLTGFVSSCKYDDDEVWDSVNDLKDRVTALEAATKQLNNDIAALQTIVSALQKQVTVAQVETLADGYIIHFSDGTKATIKNGENGKDGVNAPIINVAKLNGVYYWTITIDGKTEWLTDEDGNKLAVTGKDGATGSEGASGNTPLLKVDDNGYWVVSYDNGSTYAPVLGADGAPVKAEGENGDSKFKGVEEGDGYIVVTLADGTEYKIPMVASVKYTDAVGNEVSASGIALAAGEKVVLNYSVAQLGSKYWVEVFSAQGVKVTANESNKQLKIELIQGSSVAEARAVVLFYNANQTITSVLTFAQSVTQNDVVDALNQDVQEINIRLASDVTLDVAAWQNNALGGQNTETITIDGQGKTITFNQTNSDWNNITTNGAKIIIKNAHITNSGYNNGPWNRHDLNFACDVELIGVTSDKAIALKSGGKLVDVTINDANSSDTYALWIQPNGQTVTLEGCTIDMIACNDGRGIKIDEQYVDSPAKVTLNVSNTVIKTDEKAAILVKSKAGADIHLTNVDITEVAADSTNPVWVDEASAAYYDLVTVTGGTKIQE